MWMPPQTTTPALSTTRSASGTKSAGRGEDDYRVELLGGSHARLTCPNRPHPPGKRLRGLVAGPSEGKNFSSLVPGNLRHDMSGRSKTINPQPLGRSGHDQRAITNQAGTQQRSRRGRVDAAGNWKAKVFVGQRHFGIAAVEGAPGEAGPVAQILLAPEAIGALAAGMPQPADPNPLSDGEPTRAGTQAGHGANNFMPRNDRQPGLTQLVVNHVQIGPADAAGLDPDQHLPPARFRFIA